MRGIRGCNDLSCLIVRELYSVIPFLHSLSGRYEDFVTGLVVFKSVVKVIYEIAVQDLLK